MTKLNKSCKISYKEMIYSPGFKLEVLAGGKFMNYEFYILNLGTHPTAYIKIPSTHKFYRQDYSFLEDKINLKVNGGLTFSSDKLQLEDEEVYGWFIGWDYAHYLDYSGHYLDPLMKKSPTMKKLVDWNEIKRKWTTEEIFQEVVDAIMILRNEE